uniref:tRNA-binding domain-containing protein n=1 Tax=Hyaloperonospora arabidopsidis (strain Emoy2) TaxID=559515 RepID=M4BIG3_HYAAE
MSAAEQIENLISSVEADLGIEANAPVTEDNKQQQQTDQKEQSKRVKTPKTPKVSAIDSNQPEITKLDIRVGHIINVWKHETADKLYCEEIDVGEDAPRQIASGLVPHYTLEEMQDRRVLVLCNLKARNLVGFRSHGMVLCAAVPLADGKEHVVFVTPPLDAKVGERITFPGLVGEPLSPAQVEKKKVLAVLGDAMKTDDKGVAKWLEHEFTTSAGPCTALVNNGVIR